VDRTLAFDESGHLRHSVAVERAGIADRVFVPFDRGYEAIPAVETLRDRIAPHLFIAELRAIATDDLWMSMAYKRSSLAIHFTWKPETDAAGWLNRCIRGSRIFVRWRGSSVRRGNCGIGLYTTMLIWRDRSSQRVYLERIG